MTHLHEVFCKKKYLDTVISNHCYSVTNKKSSEVWEVKVMKHLQQGEFKILHFPESEYRSNVIMVVPWAFQRTQASSGRSQVTQSQKHHSKESQQQKKGLYYSCPLDMNSVMVNILEFSVVTNSLLRHACHRATTTGTGGEMECNNKGEVIQFRLDKLLVIHSQMYVRLEKSLVEIWV